MTRRGSIAYYLTAIVVGCFFMTLFFVVIGERSLPLSTRGLRDLFLLYFLALVGGWSSALVFGFLLRCIARLARMAQWWQWAATGTILLPVLLWTWSALWLHLLSSRPLPGPDLLWQTIFLAPVAATSLPASKIAALASCAAAGATTAFVLYKIHRAFEPPAQSPV